MAALIFCHILCNVGLVLYNSTTRHISAMAILNIATHPDHRGKGLARHVLNNIIDYSKVNGASFITLEVRESNTVAIGLYISSGFCEVGRLKNYYKHPSEDALILKREIFS